MSDSAVTALIVASGAFVGSILGNIARPLLEHFLSKKAQSRQLRNTNAEKQFLELYKPLYDYFNSVIPPDSGIEDLNAKERDHIVELIRKNRHLAEPVLEHALALVEYAEYSRAIDHKAFDRMLGHVAATYNGLRGRLSLPHETFLQRLRSSLGSTVWKALWQWSRLRMRIASRLRKRDDE